MLVIRSALDDMATPYDQYLVVLLTMLFRINSSRMHAGYRQVLNIHFPRYPVEPVMRMHLSLKQSATALDSISAKMNEVCL